MSSCLSVCLCVHIKIVNNPGRWMNVCLPVCVSYICHGNHGFWSYYNNNYWLPGNEVRGIIWYRDRLDLWAADRLILKGRGPTLEGARDFKISGGNFCLWMAAMGFKVIIIIIYYSNRIGIFNGQRSARETGKL